MKRNSYFCRPLDHDLEFWIFIPTTHYFHILMFYYENNSYDKIFLQFAYRYESYSLGTKFLNRRQMK
ncbi:hypothetical protein GLOIN_2v1717076 [Rhizophagus irregularis DAOM 181602=DAOM 197198]|uniref:Uncharacterized protein n=1 Tax=Rhizophagus irregularis (strain DAOM 181602 / DAOM 197198 / MUCL 43194) TaxID=747089 RepID=A0A2P4P3Q1_RHIID|nr:hypothetical protein GLOIN_2v1717076 [Rhizophagus irregularis DAOM 181602=DAOM 197198]POG60004.1 hypothetical protein GLOIN_2v1717076 [Rhizophagus irregularis DAOM 181602=DAOM 197198]GET60936.1 hypothetical protein GLOIN_2v1717076 [Rhizophagus irregularis DAOM 181602=DAOM 197198]|eukprot:XP_025166870.1 hypothetical protein GLOIN_2v1717076 [Rhizophagus irregularis DAOM 181602=DAOM 197198]